MKLPEVAFIKYLIVTTCAIPEAQAQILNYIEKESISKEKIRKKIKEIQSQADVYGVGGEVSCEQLSDEQDAQIDILQELLER